MNARDHQEGGSHYKDKAIQPIDFILANNLGFCEGNVVKYVSRYKEKGGVADLKKARHYLDFLIEREEGKVVTVKPLAPGVGAVFDSTLIKHP